jgi:hypothetical protein
VLLILSDGEDYRCRYTEIETTVLVM